ncbi:fluoride efflux transporter FluC [Streptomyces sp. NPDC049040]|uniref:fluoride efflux transporter FluC n=1 Tax=Streptomyces sp. NPDC049040 TaxID=3365593 RepID=UPI0037144E9A
MPESVQHLIGPGLCATLSTYSTFSSENLRLAETGSRCFAIANVGVSLVAGLGTAYLGRPRPGTPRVNKGSSRSGGAP